MPRLTAATDGFLPAVHGNAPSGYSSGITLPSCAQYAADRGCRTLFPVGFVDHFVRFGLPREYAVDLKALERAYERLSFQLHPDLMAAAPPEERQRAQQASADVNEGYRILAHEAERAAYLLGLLAQEKLLPGAKLNMEALPPGFLQEMFLLQEEVDEAGAGDPATLAPLRAQVEARREKTLKERAHLFENAGNAAALQAIQSNLNQEKYLLRLLERLNGSNPGAAL